MEKENTTTTSNTTNGTPELTPEGAKRLLEAAANFDIRDTDEFGAFEELYKTGLGDVVCAAEFVASCATYGAATASVRCGKYVYSVERRPAD